MKELFHWIILYDIRDAKRLVKVSKVMESYGWRVQKSVFESDADELTIETLKNRLKEIIDEEVDFVLFFNVCEKDWQKTENYGKSEEKQIMNELYAVL